MSLGVALYSSAQEALKNSDEVTLVVSGDGYNKEEATNVALRSAIEQTFGTFVSSNSEILNDKLVKDEIITVSSGSIKNFSYVTEFQRDGKYFITLKAIVSIGKLVEYTKSKGGQTELAGALFATKVKMNKLYAENEMKALQNLRKEIKSFLPYIFDYEIQVEDPTEYQDSDSTEYHCDAQVEIKVNDNINLIRDIFYNTLQAISLPYIEQEEYRKMKLNITNIAIQNSNDGGYYYLRNTRDDLYNFFSLLQKDILQEVLSFKVIDNIGEYKFIYSDFYDYNYTSRNQFLISGFAVGYDRQYYYCHTKAKRFSEIDGLFGSNSSRFIIEGNSGTYDSVTYLLGLFDRDLKLYSTIDLTLRYSLDELMKISNISVKHY